MDITFLAQKLNINGGGSNFSLDLMARSLASRGHNVKIATIESDQNMLPESHPYTVIERTEEFRTVLGQSRILKKVIADLQTDTDVFHLFNPNYMTGGGRYRKSGGEKPVICRLNQYTPFCTNLSRINNQCYKNCTVRKKFEHDTETTPKKIGKAPFYAFRTYLAPRLANKVDQFFAISPQVKEVYNEIGIKNERISIVPNFYNPDFTPNNYNGESVVASTPRFLYVGRLVEPKGIDILLEATAKIAQQQEKSNFIIDIVGTGPDRERLERLSFQRNVEEIVNFHGRVDHNVVGEYYERSSALVHPGRWPEPFGRTLLEALQYRCPLIVSDIGGPPWIAGEAGFIFPPEDVTELAETMQSIILNPDILENKKAACGEQLERFEPDTVISEIEEEYYVAINQDR